MGHYNDVVHLSWSPDSRFFLTGSKDMSAKIYSVNPVEGFEGATLTGHRDVVVGGWFSADAQTVYTVGRDGALFIWNATDELGQDEGENVEHKKTDREDRVISKRRRGPDGERIFFKRWRTTERHYFNQNHAKIVCASFHAASKILVVGFTSGIFGLWELPDFNNIHTLR